MILPTMYIYISLIIWRLSMSKICMVGDCHNKSSKAGYCNAHYLRLRRNGVTDKVRKVGRGQCIIDGCENKQAAHGLCNKHYSRKMRTGDPEKVLTTATGDPHLYFKDVVLTYDGNECLDWAYNKHGKGYGQLWDSGKTRYLGVHRLVCEHFNGPPPHKSSHAAHACGNPWCCNHKHIRWATPSENNQDKKGHGTWQGGETNGNSRLTEYEVREIKGLGSSGLSQRKIASMFNVTQRTIWMILNGKSWTHINI